MALTLDATLAARMNSQSRNPIVQIISDGIIADIPFDGQRLTTETSDEQRPNVIIHSSGRLCLVYKLSTGLRYFYTDTDRTVFTPVDISLPVGQTLEDAALCEIANGNIGIIYRSSSGGGSTQYLRYQIITVTGGLVSSDQITSYGSTPWLSGPTVIKTSGGDYLMVFTRLDGSDYKFYKFTSSNFTSWGSASEISIGGLTSTQKVENPHLLQITTGAIWLWFDYFNEPTIAQLSNLYYSISSDGGSTWGAAVKVTSYTTPVEVANHPVAVQKQADSMYVAFTKEIGCLQIGYDASGWCGDDATGGDVHFDSVTRKLYIKSIDMGYGGGALFCVAEIDVDTWMVTGCWNYTTTPAFDDYFQAGCAVGIDHGERYLVPVSRSGAGLGTVTPAIALLNADADTITHYWFEDVPAEGITRNVDHDIPDGKYIYGTWVDFDSLCLYVYFGQYAVGYFDLTEVPSPNYTFTRVVSGISVPQSGIGSTRFAVYPDDDLVLVSANVWTVDWYGGFCAYILSTGALWKSFSKNSHPEFPWNGIQSFTYVGGKVYGEFLYRSDWGQADKRGLCEINLTTEAISFHRPDWASVDDYGLWYPLAISGDRILIIAEGYGITIYDITSDSWELFTPDNVPGLIYDEAGAIDYDPTNGFIFGGCQTDNWPNGDQGIFMFSEEGYLKQSQYFEGTYAGGAWSWGAIDNLVQGYADYEIAIADGPGTEGIWGFWTNDYGTGLGLKWDKENSQLDLSPFLAKDNPIALRRTVDNKPHELTFSVSSGNLFDPHNTFSTYSSLLKKGRKLTLKFGDKIGGINYWQNQGIFLVTETVMSYERPKYPMMGVKAQDRRCTWDHHQIIATSHYEDYPETILEDILKDHLGFIVGDITISNFDIRVEISNQWIECLAKDIIDQICDRFGYFHRLTVDDKFTCRKISDANSTDHTYSDLTKIINFTPDDSYSDFINKIIVVGYEATEIEVLSAEERVGSLNGTIGWWQNKKTYDVYYSVDGLRKCRYPRLLVIESVASIGMQVFGGISESITYESADENYVTITIEVPNMLWFIFSMLTLIVANYLTGDFVVAYGAGWTKPVGTLIQMICIVALTMVLSAVGNFQYEIWAQPVSLARRQLQNTDDHGQDEDFQTEINQVVLLKFEDPLCASQTECNQVADHEILIKKLQRKRVNLSKMADLRDEEGDTIQIPHPASGQALKIFMTELTRTMVIPSPGNEGYFIDEIEGWRL